MTKRKTTEPIAGYPASLEPERRSTQDNQRAAGCGPTEYTGDPGGDFGGDEAAAAREPATGPAADPAPETDAPAQHKAETSAAGKAETSADAAEPPVPPRRRGSGKRGAGRPGPGRPGAAAPTETNDDREQTYTIGTLAEEFGITTRAIRFYEARKLIAPNRRGTQRFYTRRDRARLIIILRAKNLGFSLEDVAAYLDLYDADPGQFAQTRLLLQKVETSMANLQKKRADLDRSLRDLKELRSRCIEHLDKVRQGGN